MKQKVEYFKSKSELCGLGDFFLQVNVTKNGYEPLYINSKLFASSLKFISSIVQSFTKKTR